MKYTQAGNEIYGDGLIDQNGYFVCTFPDGEGCFNPPSVRRLLEAAPDMFEALAWAERALAPFSKEPAEKSGINMIRAALAKARGET